MKPSTVRLAAIGFRRFTAEPEARRPAALMLARNALRMLVEVVGQKEAARVVLQVLTEEQPK